MLHTMASKIYPFLAARLSSDILPSNMAWMNQTSFYQALKPLFWCMKIVGLLNGVPLLGKENDTNTTKSCAGRIYTIYAVLVILILWFNLALALSTFIGVSEFNGIVCNQIITSMWFFQIAHCSVCNFFLSKHLKGLCEQFDRVAKSINFDNYGYIRKCGICATILFVMWICIAFTFTALGTYFASGSTAGPFGNVSPAVAILMRIIFLIIYFYFTSTWYLIISSFFVVCLVLTKTYKHFNKNFKKCFKNGRFIGDIEKSRKQHEQLCRVLAQADKVFSMYVMSSIGTVIPLIIFTLYFVLFESVDTFSFIATWWSACLSMIQILIIFLGGGVVNHQVR